MEASLIFGFVIFVNAMYLGYEVDNRPKEDTTGFWFFVDNLFTLTFVFELLLRIRAEGPLRTFSQRWNQFDGLMVFMAIVDTYVVPNMETGLGQGNLRMFSMLRMLRLLKILRVIRLLRMFSDLWIMCLSLWHGLQSLVWLAVLIFFFIYTIGLVLTRLIGKQYGDEDPEVEFYWGTVPSSLLSLFIVMTGEDWPNIAATAERHQFWTRFLFVFFIGVTNLALLNLITGVIIDKVFFHEAGD
jgi:voltage-gated sodium channel